MKKMPDALEIYFERLSGFATRLFAHWLMFLLALVLVAYWLIARDWTHTSRVDAIRDVILCVTFLSFFIIQKSFSRFSLALQLKLDELVATQEKARNELIRAEEKSEAELKEIAKEHERLIPPAADK